MSALEENLDIKIDDYATFNWKSVAEAINILGGIDLEITPAEFKYINGFITETVNSTGIGSYQLEQAGMNHLERRSGCGLQPSASHGYGFSEDGAPEKGGRACPGKSKAG